MAKKKFGLSSTLNKNKKVVVDEEAKLSKKVPLKRTIKNYEEVGKRVDEIHVVVDKKLVVKQPNIQEAKVKKKKPQLVRMTVDVPVDLHKALKMKMAQEGTTIRKYILRLLHKDLKIK